MQTPHRLVSALLFLVALLIILLVPVAAALAQKPVKADILPLFDKVPAPPAAPGCALTRPAALADLDRQIGQLAQAIGAGRTPEQAREAAAMQQMGQQATAAGVDKMTDQQKLAYMQQQGSTMPGYNAQAMQMAQQMQDPAFQAKLAKMSDQEKAVYMQKMMAAPNTAQQRMVGDPAFQAAQADFMEQMKNPAFKQAWEKKSEAQQDAYMASLMRKHGLDEAKMKAIAGKQAPAAPLAPLVATAAIEAQGKLSEAAVREMSQPHGFARTQQQYQAALESLRKTQEAARLPEAREGDCRGQEQAYQQNRQHLKQRLDLMSKYLGQLATAWAARKTELKARVTPFHAELARIHYGDDIKRSEEKALISSLAGGQQLMLQHVSELVSYVGSLHDLNKEYCELKKLYDQPFRCEEATCFPATARVQLPDGRQVPISRVRPGMEVLGYDAATGRLVPTRVQRLDIHDEQSYELVQLTIGTPAVYAGLEPAAAPGQEAAELVLTPNHPVLTAAGPALRADELRPTDELLRLGNAAVETTHLADRQPAGKTGTVYNLRTATGNYFVSGVLVGSK
ncbi:Hint domain-containing protein [Hymenobacter sp. B81]|uniref:Hint domain-containing protein n=1 Tax=Hymenobacter sp. B81 TaxID=3344878 RepID=UPI0037DC4A3E